MASFDGMPPLLICPAALHVQNALDDGIAAPDESPPGSARLETLRWIEPIVLQTSAQPVQAQVMVISFNRAKVCHRSGCLGSARLGTGRLLVVENWTCA